MRDGWDPPSDAWRGSYDAWKAEEPRPGPPAKGWIVCPGDHGRTTYCGYPRRADEACPACRWRLTNAATRGKG